MSGIKLEVSPVTPGWLKKRHYETALSKKPYKMKLICHPTTLNSQSKDTYLQAGQCF
jgi:hypothetical protein